VGGSEIDPGSRLARPIGGGSALALVALATNDAASDLALITA
jgi:hypothetical protein